jgi:hypothetical protein
MFRRSRGNKKSRRVGDTSFGAGGTFGGNTGTPTRTGMMLNLGAGAAGQLERLKQIQPKPAPIKIVRVPTAAIVSSPPSRRVAIPPAPPVLPPPRVNPPPRSKFKGDNFEPLVRPQIVTQAQINPKQRERNMALQPRSEFVPPRNPIVKSFSPNIIPRPFAFNTNPMVVPPRNIPTKPIAIGGPSYLVRGLPSDKAFTDEVVANTSGGSLNEGLQPMAVLMDEYDAKANEIRNNPFATQNTGQLEQEVINQIGEKPILTKPPIKTLPKPDPIPPRPKPIIPNDDFNLSVNSDPTGADIFLDGAKVGTTGTILKLPMKSLQGVTKKLTAKLTGYTSRLGTDACYYTISGVATTIQIKENFDVFEDPDDFFDERIMLGPNSFNNFGGQGSPEGYGRNNFLRGQERLDTLGRGTGAYGPAPGSLSRTNIRKRITKTRLKNVDKYIVVIKKYELGKEVSAPPIAGNLANLNFQFKKLIIDIKDDDVKDDYPKDVKDPPKPIEPELLIVSKGGRMDTFRVSAKGNGSTVTNSAGNYKSANSFDITITQVDGYNIKGFGILKGQIDDQPDAPSMEKLDLNELNISVGGKMTIYIDWGDQIKIVKPSVRLNNSSYTLNTAEVSAGMGGVTIGYLSENADNIKLQLRKTTRNNNLEAGTFSLNPNVFSEGVGQYVGYIIPSNSGYGDGDKVRFVVNVISKSYLPGPDIINITYPSLVKGADFRGLDVNFSIG